MGASEAAIELHVGLRLCAGERDRALEELQFDLAASGYQALKPGGFLVHLEQAKMGLLFFGFLFSFSLQALTKAKLMDIGIIWSRILL